MSEVGMTDPQPRSPPLLELAWLPWGYVAFVLMLYVAVTKWLVGFGPLISASLLTSQLVAYPTVAIIALGPMRLLGCEMPWGGRTSLRWVSILSVGCAVAVLVARFFLKQPPSGWTAHSTQEWRDIADGYVVGRMLVPVAEEVLFRGLLFCPFHLRHRDRSFAAVVLSACIFAGLHWGPIYGLPAAKSTIDVLSALAAGLAFGALRAWTGSILPGLGLHVIGNSIGF